ncbi:MAG: DUF1080 domain-containing protein [Verrucomicrobiales bacterium]|nr:DUF1080 domain-containing protein [Verrucomicrobiales bacterium]
MKTLQIIVAFAFIISPICGADEAKWTSLFDGKSLKGWNQKGGKAKYSVEENCIVGRTVPRTPNSFLCTDKKYGDFILEYEFKIDPRLNSGVQIRSQENQNGRVYGYQVEIDPDTDRNRMWTAGIYDEGRRGWLNDLSKNEAARKAFKPNEWNNIKVRAVGDSIRTWLNGVPAADLVDSMTQSGFIGLQVHGIGNKADGPYEVRWKNIKIQDLGIHEWKPIFDGKTLNGWRALPGGTWTVKDGTILGKSPREERRHGILLTEKQFKDFTVKANFRVNSGDSGFYFRCEPVKGGVSVHGFQVEVDYSQETGGLYETGGRGWVIKPNQKEIPKKKYKPGEWTDLSLSAHDGRIVVHINGQKTAELINDKGRKSGHIGLQLHGGDTMDVEFKNISILTAK